MEVASNVLGKEKEDRATLLNERNGNLCKTLYQTNNLPVMMNLSTVASST